MAKSEKLQRRSEFETAWRTQWDKTPIPVTLPPGTVWRIDILKMVGAVDSWSADATLSLVGKLGEALDELLAGNATRWSPAPGLIDIHCGTMSRQAADLKHAVVASTIERCVREIMRKPVGAKSTSTPVQRRLDWAAFQAVCVKGKAQIDQTPVLDVGEALFGSPEPDQKLSLRVWTAVYEVLDRHLEGVGYCTRKSRNRVLLYFPGYSKAMGNMKRKVMATEIAGLGNALVEGDEESEPDVAASRTAESGRGEKKPIRVGEKPDPEQGHINMAYAALAASRSGDAVDAISLTFPADYDVRPVPMWWSEKHTVGGSVMETVRKVGEEWDRFFPTSTEESDMLDFPVLARALDRINELMAAGKSSLVVVPLYWASIGRVRRRDRVLAFCSHLSEAARRMLVLELAGVPEDLMAARVEECIIQLRPYCRAVTIRVRLGRRNFSQLKKLPFHAVGVDFGELPDYERGIIPGFDAFMDAVEPLGMKTFAHGLNTKSMLVAVQAAGVDYVAGPIIPESEEEPLGIRDFTISDLYGTSAAV